MRDYLFRGKRTDGKGWAFGSYVKADGKHYIFTGQTGLSQASPVHQLMYRDFVRYEVFPETVGQYTGLYDKNGNKIFEGDIVRVRGIDAHGTKVDLTDMVDDIRNVFLPFAVGNALDCDSLEVTVIGNIHDNPEVLKEE